MVLPNLSPRHRDPNSALKLAGATAASIPGPQNFTKGMETSAEK